MPFHRPNRDNGDDLITYRIKRGAFTTQRHQWEALSEDATEPTELKSIKNISLLRQQPPLYKPND